MQCNVFLRRAENPAEIFYLERKTICECERKNI